MFEMHCEELIRALVKRADVICGRLIAKMFRDHQEVNTRYGVSATASVCVLGVGHFIVSLNYSSRPERCHEGFRRKDCAKLTSTWSNIL